jgi:DNA topoisomerase-3
MAAAENLYRSGLISYPRTETNRFHPSVNLTNCVTQLLKHDKYKYLAQKLLEKKMEPRFGNQNDQAHGPIYPTRAPDKPLENVEAALYELIAENFLLCLCEDAEYEKKTIAIVKEDMKFSMQANQIIKEGFLAYSTTDSLRTKKLPELKQGDKLTLKRLKMNTKQTPEPPRLTESMLISRMEAHKIGTDSTIHEHIRNIQEKGYAAKILEEFTPTKLGMGVINAYRSIGSELCNTNLRADMEQNVRDISEGKLDYNEALTKDLKRFEEMYSKVEASKSKFLEGFNRVYKAELKQSSNSPTHDNDSIQCQ